ncbi:MAG TPA: hypothetical protein VGH44_06790 [Candidatus Saccharimonadia bacterium]|jgi:hypothetical protein
MVKLWLAVLTALGYFAILIVLHALATQELASLQFLYTTAQTQAATISASNR